jgi:chromosome segregation ATPase
MSDDIVGKRAEWDPIFLYTRTDEKYEEVNAQMQDVRLAQQMQQGSITKLEERIDNAVSKGTHRNTEKITELAVKVADLNQKVERMLTQLNDPEAGLFKTLKEWKHSVDNLYRGILTVFFGAIVTGVIVYLLKNFELIK